MRSTRSARKNDFPREGAEMNSAALPETSHPVGISTWEVPAGLYCPALRIINRPAGTLPSGFPPELFPRAFHLNFSLGSFADFNPEKETGNSIVFSWRRTTFRFIRVIFPFAMVMPGPRSLQSAAVCPSPSACGLFCEAGTGSRTRQPVSPRKYMRMSA